MRSRLDTSGIREIKDIARKIRCRLIISHTVRGAVIAHKLKHLIAVPWIHHVHSPALYESENTVLNWINYLIEKYILTDADHILPVSNALAKYIQSKYSIPFENITVIHNGVEHCRVTVPRSIRRYDPIVLGMIGLFRHRKGIEVLLKSLRQVMLRGIRFELRLIGGFVTDRYRNYIIRLVNHLGLESHIKYLGFCQNVLKELEHIDVVVMPSLYGEGLPMALIEAMSVGKVIIASNIDGIDEVIENGRSGILVEPNSLSEISSAIDLVARDPTLRNQLSIEAMLLQRRCFSINSMERSIFEIYRRYSNISAA